MAGSRILDNLEAVWSSSQWEATRSGATWSFGGNLPPGIEFTVITNTAQAAAGADCFNGIHSVGLQVRVNGMSQPAEPAFIALREVPAAEVLVLIKDS
jgi:hypothetical protein